MAPLVSVVIGTCNRKEDLRKVLRSVQDQNYENVETIVINNGSEDNTKDLFTEGGEFNQESIRAFHYKDSLGVTKARNIGYEKSNGEIIITLDDDAIFDSNKSVKKIVRKFAQNERVGIISFRIENFYTGDIEPATFPHRNKDPETKTEFFTTYFAGGGNAIRKEVFEKAGTLPEGFMYGFEELDLSFRVLDCGYRILYFPEILVLHKNSPGGRFPEDYVIVKRLENRIKVGLRNLPWRYVVSSTIIWTCYSLYLSRFKIHLAVKSFVNIYRSFDEIMNERDTVSKETIQYLKSNSGRLYY